MSARLSSPALRTLLFDLLSELADYNSTILPNGATAFDSQSDTLWRLDKDAGTTFDSLIGSGLLLKPNDNTAARWFAQSIAGSSPYQHASYLAASVAVTMTSNQWNQLGSTAGTFGTSSGSPPLYTLNPTTGLITYNGPALTALVVMSASLNNGIGATAIDIHAAISRSGDVVDGSTTNYPEKSEQLLTITDAAGLVVVKRVMQLNPSTTLQLMLRNSTNEDDVVANYYDAAVAPI